MERNDKKEKKVTPEAMEDTIKNLTEKTKKKEKDEGAGKKKHREVDPPKTPAKAKKEDDGPRDNSENGQVEKIKPPIASANQKETNEGKGSQQKQAKTPITPAKAQSETPKPLAASSGRADNNNDFSEVSSSRTRDPSGKENGSLPSLVNEIFPEEYVEYANMSNKALFKESCKRGLNLNSITSRTERAECIKQLKKLSGNQPRLSGDQAGFCQELRDVITGNYDKKLLRQLQKNFDAIFKNTRGTCGMKDFCVGLWRYFSYILICPSTTKSKSEKESFQAFLRSIFYIGKATKGRPVDHFIEARTVLNDSNEKSSAKLDKICESWESDISIRCFHFFLRCGEKESFSRESLMIEALGLSNLTNVKRGWMHEELAKWPESHRRLLGSFFLKYAFDDQMGRDEQLYILPNA